MQEAVINPMNHSLTDSPVLSTYYLGILDNVLDDLGYDKKNKLPPIKTINQGYLSHKEL